MINAGGSKFKVTSKGSDFAKCLSAMKARAPRCYNAAVSKFVVHLNEAVVAKTPVWEGSTIRNWLWSIGRPSIDYIEPEGQDIPTGRTSQMAIGDEPRRQVNQEAQAADFARFLLDLSMMTQPETIYLTNNAPQAALVEYGETPRVQSFGMLRLAIIEVLEAWGR